MPNYDYRCTKCNSEWEIQLPIAQRDAPVELGKDAGCPECGEKETIERFLAGAPGTPTHTGDSLSKRVPNSFKDVLRNIKSQHRGSTINIPS